MAHFYGNMKGARGETTRCGNKSSGMFAHVRGWKLGVEVRMSYDEKTGEDICTVVLTDGSHATRSKTIGQYRASDLTPKLKQSEMFGT